MPLQNGRMGSYPPIFSFERIYRDTGSKKGLTYSSACTASTKGLGASNKFKESWCDAWRKRTAGGGQRQKPGAPPYTQNTMPRLRVKVTQIHAPVLSFELVFKDVC